MAEPYFRITLQRYSHALNPPEKTQGSSRYGNKGWSNEAGSRHTISFRYTKTRFVRIILTSGVANHFKLWEKELIRLDKNRIKYVGPIGLSVGRTGERISVLILCASTTCLMCKLDDLREDDARVALIDFFERRRESTFYGTNVHENVQDLRKMYGIDVHKFEDVMHLKDFENPPSFERLVEKELGFPNPYFLPTIGGWEAFNLDDLHISYGSFHAYCCYALGAKDEDKKGGGDEDKKEAGDGDKKGAGDEGKKKARTSNPSISIAPNPPLAKRWRT